MPYLIEQSSTSKNEIHKLENGSNTIGRELDNTIVIMDQSLSRRHAEIIVEDNHCLVKDLGSLNHTFVNDIQVQQAQIKHGDWIRYGNVMCQFMADDLSTGSSIAPHNLASLSYKMTQPAVHATLDPKTTLISIQELLSSQEDLPTKGTVLKLRGQDNNQRTVDKLKILLEVSKVLSSPDEPEHLLEKVLELIFEIMRVDRTIILLLEPRENELVEKCIKFRSGIPENKQFYSKTIVNMVFERGESLLTSDASADQRLNESHSVFMQEIHASMCIPLKPRNEVIGVLYVDNLTAGNIYTEEDLEFLTALTTQAAIALDNSNLYQQIQKEAVIRSKFEQFFPKAISKKLREDGVMAIVEREVTVIFADITKFTEMSSLMHPRQLIEMLNEYFTVMVEDIVFRYEGTLEKYIGDALLAVWGAPYQTEDHADRGLRAAIAMQKAVTRLNQRWSKERGLEVSIHIGVNTGRVAAGNIGSKNLIQYATIGDTTNIASRICNVAKANEIVISQATLDRLSYSPAPVTKMPPTIVKGKDYPLDLYKVEWGQAE